MVASLISNIEKNYYHFMRKKETITEKRKFWTDLSEQVTPEKRRLY